MAARGRPKKPKKEPPRPFRSLASAYREPTVVPTGIVALDAALGGGVYAGRGVELFGPSRGGKTALAMEIARAFQDAGGPPRGKADRRGHWAVVGEHFDLALFLRLGGDADLLDYDEDIDVIEDYVDTLARWAKAHADRRVPKVAVLDSLAMIKTRAEVAGGMDTGFDDRAKQIYRGLRNLQGPLSRSGTTFLMINQIRQRRLPPGDFRNPETTPGGWGPEFYTTLRLRLSQGTLKRGKKALIRAGGRADGRVVGHRIQVRVDKNRMMPAEGQAVELAWMFETGFDACAGVFRLLADNDVLEEKTRGSDDGKEVFELNGKRVTDEAAFVEEHADLILEIPRRYRPRLAEAAGA